MHPSCYIIFLFNLKFSFIQFLNLFCEIGRTLIFFSEKKINFGPLQHFCGLSLLPPRAGKKRLGDRLCQWYSNVYFLCIIQHNHSGLVYSAPVKLTPSLECVCRWLFRHGYLSTTIIIQIRGKVISIYKQ